MPDPRHSPAPQASPGVATAEHGLVMLDGLAGVAMTMTGEAAVETGRRLIAAGEEAERQLRDPRA